MLAIAEPRADQRHIKIAYRPGARAQLRAIHLAWHHHLRDEDDLGAKYRCVVLRGVPLALQPTIVAQCKRSASADVESGLPYGFGPPRTSVMRDERTGRLVIEGASGLTCATFVLAILRLANVELAALDTWESRDGDDEWKAGIVDALEQSGASPAHVVAVREDSGHTRVRPEDVAGAATESVIPVVFARANELGARLLAELR